MQVAIITKTGEQVQVVSINGGWTTVRTVGADSREMKVRNGALSGHTTVTGKVAEHVATNTKAKAKKDKAPAQPRAKKSPDERLNGVVYSGYLPQYEAYSIQLSDGTKKRSIDKGDNVALLLRKLTLDVVYETAANATGISQQGLRDRFAHLNPGMQRMNLGNMIRRVMKEQGNA